MAKQREVAIEAVKAGEVIEIVRYPNKHQEQVIVNPACENKNNGHWYCVTHHEHFQNNLMKDFHISQGKHRLVWICHEHGAEEP